VFTQTTGTRCVSSLAQAVAVCCCLSQPALVRRSNVDCVNFGEIMAFYWQHGHLYVSVWPACYLTHNVCLLIGVFRCERSPSVLAAGFFWFLLRAGLFVTGFRALGVAIRSLASLIQSVVYGKLRFASSVAGFVCVFMKCLLHTGAFTSGLFSHLQRMGAKGPPVMLLMVIGMSAYVLFRVSC
jgi:hypothetical protein